MYAVHAFINGRNNDPVINEMESYYAAFTLVLETNKQGHDAVLHDKLWRTATRYNSKATAQAIEQGEHDEAYA